MITSGVTFTLKIEIPSRKIVILLEAAQCRTILFGDDRKKITAYRKLILFELNVAYPVIIISMFTI